jgi:hypothetical protein
VEDDELETIEINGFSSFWALFLRSVCAPEKLPKFENLWNDFN